MLILPTGGMAVDLLENGKGSIRPKRKIPRKSICYRGYMPSVAMNTHLLYESRSIEKKLYRFLDFLFILGFVRSIYTQPFAIEYSEGRLYHPDALVTFTLNWLKPWLVEGKGGYFDKQKLQDMKPKFRAAMRFAKEKGYIFHIVTEAQLNLIDDDILPFLKTHRGVEVAAIRKKAVLQVLKQFGPMHPREVSENCLHLLQVEVPIDAVWRMAAKGEIFCDLSKPPMETIVASPTVLDVQYLRRNGLFELPFGWIEGANDKVL